MRDSEYAEPAAAPVVIVGGGLAGATCALRLRALGFKGDVVVVEPDDDSLVDRPQLSKQFQTGDGDESDLARITTWESLAGLGVRRETVTAAGLDIARRRVALSDGRHLDYGTLVVASGCRARNPVPEGLSGFLPLRGLDDARAIRSALSAAQRVVVVGGGVLGVELACSAAAAGREVVLVHGGPAPLDVMIGPELGARVGKHLASLGVQVVCDELAGSFAEHDGSPSVRLQSGHRLTGDLVLLGVGAEPVTGWLDRSGLDVQDGVLVDGDLRAAPAVYAIGDVARCRAEDGSSVRLENWHGAVDEAEHVARSVAEGATPPAHPAAYVWCDVADLRVEVLGRLGDPARMTVWDGGGAATVALCRDERGERCGVVTLGHRPVMIRARANAAREGLARACELLEDLMESGS